MPLCYEKNKLHIYRWRENNYEKTKTLNRRHQSNHYNTWKDYLKTCRDFRKFDNHLFQ